MDVMIIARPGRDCKRGTRERQLTTENWQLREEPRESAKCVRHKGAALPTVNCKQKSDKGTVPLSDFFIPS